MKFNQWVDAVNYRITSGGEYGWDCFGPNAQIIDADHAAGPSVASASIIFDTITQDVYQATVCDIVANRAYRWTDPDYDQAYQDEVKLRHINDVAWDDVKYIDLEIEEDYFEKAQSIIRGEKYDTRIQIPVDLEDDLILGLAMEAHKRDITLNKMIEIVLREVINRSTMV
jgi:hypothetical protein